MVSTSEHESTTKNRAGDRPIDRRTDHIANAVLPDDDAAEWFPNSTHSSEFRHASWSVRGMAG